MKPKNDIEKADEFLKLKENDGWVWEDLEEYKLYKTIMRKRSMEDFFHYLRRHKLIKTSKTFEKIYDEFQNE